MYRWYRYFGPFYETPGGGGGGTATIVDVNSIKSIEELPAALKAQVNDSVQAALRREREKHNQTDTSAADKVELERLRKAEEVRVQKDLEAKGDYERALKSKDEGFATERTAFVAKEQRITSRLREKSIDSEIISAGAEQGAHNPKQLAILLHDQVKLTDDFEAQVLDDKGKAAFKNGEPLTVAELVTQYLDANPHLRKPANTGGSGSKGGKSTDAEGSSHDAGTVELTEAVAKLKIAEELAQKQPSAAHATAAHKLLREVTKLKREAESKKGK